MNHLSKKIRWLCLAAILIGSAGCSKTDADTMSGIGHKIADRTQFISEIALQTWTRATGRGVLESRVKDRLCWDKLLEDAAIEVHAMDAKVELKGSVATPEQLRRAQDLAESTLGVEKVVNSLHVEPVSANRPTP